VSDLNKTRNFGFLMYDVTRRSLRRFEHHARHLGLTLAQCKALALLYRNEGVSQTRLADLANIEPMHMVRILDYMEAERLLERRPDPADRRARRLYLTDKAQPLLDAIREIGEKTRVEVLAGLSKSDCSKLSRMLELVHNNLCNLQSQEDDAHPPASRPARVTRKTRQVGRSHLQASS